MILVTGGTGMVGAHILFELTNKGNMVKAIYRNENNIKKAEKIFSFYTNDKTLFKKITWVNADTCNYYSLENIFEDIDIVYHCAAMVSFNPRNRKKIIQNNILSTENIVNLCLNKNVKKLLHVSSIASLEQSEINDTITEENKWKNSEGKSPYSLSKFKSEMEVWRGINEGLNAIIVNPSVIIGPGDWSTGSPSIIDAIGKGLKFYLPGMTGFVDVRDVAKASIELMESEITNERFILNTSNQTYPELFKMIAQELNVKAPNILVNKFLASITWRILKIISLVFNTNPKVTKETVTSGFNFNKYSSKKIRETINYNFIPIEEAITNACRCYKIDTK